MDYFEKHKGGERAILVHLDIRQMQDPDDLGEFELLADSAGADRYALVTGSRMRPDAKYFVGSGKAQEIAELVREHDADIVLFNHSLSPSQERNLEALVKCRVLDRIGLILDIFAQRARTHEGKLQVELAQLNHLSTRLVRGWTHLERQKAVSVCVALVKLSLRPTVAYYKHESISSKANLIKFDRLVLKVGPDDKNQTCRPYH